ncbi:MAG: Acetyl-CoA acetyltransferase [candidate division Zixibacteria bacterium RBG-1]|nr:MAG: Acetyl-CoA acetyltransferase [candidate division Zixibacteria bacterium RBG-1]OGC86278.1 MAG: acetyl-CoA acetyltransferase [candidate division Zixibacteria bacterium RBG_19FT_COMBO_42_43]
MELSEIVAISAVRTPMGKFGGSLKDVPVYELGALVIKEVLNRAGIEGEDVDEVIFGNCRQAGNGPNPSRTAAVKGGIPVSKPTQTINMACPSGMKTIALASQSIRLGESEIVLTGGMESMSTIPYLLKNVRWEGFKMGDKVLMDGWGDNVDPLCNLGMGQTAENLFKKYKISREEQDRFALGSHKKAASAWEKGFFKEEVVPVEFKDEKNKSNSFAKDETIRTDTSIDKLSSLKPAFAKDGTVTAGNACSMSDGAAALVITSRKKAQELGKTPLFSILSYSQIAVEPETMGDGPALSIPLALKQVKMNLADMNLIEINEAFAIQVLANQRVLNFDLEKLNVHGGAIALGHPTGISGARILVTLYYALKNYNKEIGIAGICGGGGVSMAMIIKRES